MNPSRCTTHDPAVLNAFFAAPMLPPTFAPANRLRPSHVEQLVVNFLTTRLDRFRRLADPRRNVAAECGHPTDYTARQYQDLVDANGLAARVNELYACATWAVQPTLYEREDVEDPTDYERAWDALGGMLSGNTRLKQEEGSPLWKLLEQADVDSGIGRYGVILLGLDDGLPLSAPPAARRGQKLLYARSASEAYARISTWEKDESSPRFGQPAEYSITFGDPTVAGDHGDGPASTTRAVHWMRVVHLCDGGVVYARPRLQQVLPYVLDCAKIAGADAESVWQQVVAGMIFQTDPSFAGEVEVDADRTRDEYEKFVHGLQRSLVLNGVTASRPTPNLADPGPHLLAQLQLIAIRMNVPMRVLMGSERGELASSQDARKWAADVRSRRNLYATPRIIAPFAERLITLGVLPEPREYRVSWPDGEAQTAQEKADVALKLTQALAAFVAGDCENAMGLTDYYVRVWGWTEEEAEATIANVQGMLGGLRGKEEDAEEQRRDAAAERMRQGQGAAGRDGDGNGEVRAS